MGFDVLDLLCLGEEGVHPLLGCGTAGMRSSDVWPSVRIFLMRILLGKQTSYVLGLREELQMGTEDLTTKDTKCTKENQIPQSQDRKL